MAMFHMANDSHLFRTAPGEGLLSLYETKDDPQFDHRFATYEDCTRLGRLLGKMDEWRKIRRVR
jgi:hypothetical protein